MLISVIVIAKNEADNIRNCLESVPWADEVIVLDSGSTDDTVAIAKEYTDKVYCTDWQGYGIQKQRALTHASGKWVLNLDADESVDEKLKQDILQAIHLDEADAYRIPIQMCFYGRPLRYSYSPKRHIRLFKRVGAQYSDDIVHEKICLPENTRICRLKSAIHHQSFRDLSHALYKVNRYSSYTAKSRINQKKPASIMKTLLGSAWMFIRCYILQGGFLDGKDGLVLASINAQGTFYRGLKQIYHDQKIDELP